MLLLELSNYDRLMLTGHGHSMLTLRQKACTAQVHEWGGTFKNLVMHAHFRRFRPGLRVAVSLFGGHYWRTQVTSMAPLRADSPSALLICMPRSHRMTVCRQPQGHLHCFTIDVYTSFLIGHCQSNTGTTLAARFACV